MISRRFVLLSLAGIAALAVFTPLHPLDAFDGSPAPVLRPMPVFAHAEDDADSLIAYRPELGLDLQKLVHEEVGDNAAYPVNCSRAICRLSRSQHI